VPLALVPFAVSASVLGGEPLPRGAFPVRSVEWALVDSARNRRAEVALLAPDGEGTVPFVVFSRGFLLSGAAYRSTADPTLKPHAERR